MRAAERLDIAEKIVHTAVCDGHIRRVKRGDGYVRKLWRIGPSWDTGAMAGVRIDLERVVEVLRAATTTGGYSQRGLSGKAHEGRDCVGDIINGRNKNPTLKVLSNLAEAMGSDLSIFGIEDAFRIDLPTEDELAEALREAIPDMPRGSPDRRARYLAESVAQILRLPPSRRATGVEQSDRGDDRREGAPPPGATS